MDEGGLLILEGIAHEFSIYLKAAFDTILLNFPTSIPGVELELSRKNSSKIGALT
jgi:hypothetical protein